MASDTNLDGDNAGGPRQAGQAIVIGGGLAGVSAACELADRGWRVRLLEKRPYLGGRTFSFADKETGAEIDNGQHVFMRCCTHYLRLLDKLGASDKTFLQPRMRVTVIDGRQRASDLFSASLPAPLHLLPSLLRYRHLTLRDKLGVALAGLRMRRISRKRRDALDDISFYDWLQGHGQSDRAIDRFWNLVVLPILNEDVRRVSAAQAIMVFQEGFLRDAHGADIGYSRVGLSRLLFDEAPRYVEARGGAVCLGHHVGGLEGGPAGIMGALVHEKGRLEADVYVLAVPPRELQELLPEPLQRHDFFRRASRLAMSPIVNLHIWLDRQVMDGEFAAFADSEAHWVFNKSAMCQEPAANGQHLCISLSGAHKFIDMPKAGLEELFLAELRRLFPAASEARVTRFVVVKERYATFRPSPGSAALRLPWRTPVPNLFLAGEWTDTSWPSTMESAVRSGVFCAREIAGEP